MMAHATGYVCDVCKGFEYTTKEAQQLPDGWFAITVGATVPTVKDGKVQEEARKASLHVCGNRCLANLGIMRHEEATGQRFVRHYENKGGRRKKDA